MAESSREEVQGVQEVLEERGSGDRGSGGYRRERQGVLEGREKQEMEAGGIFKVLNPSTFQFAQRIRKSVFQIR